MTELVIILDKSSSMRPIAHEAVKAVNNFINSQKNGPDNCYVTVMEFADNPHYQIKRTKIEECPEVSLNPYGWTALYDAVGLAITNLNTQIKNKRKKRPTVLFVIQTDGEENRSHLYDFNQIKELIKVNQAKGDQFIFLGANFLGKIGTELGIDSQAVASFDQSAIGYSQTYTVTSRETSNLRKAAVSGQRHSVNLT